jgi:tyrosyl-tRNA synthetase
VEEAPVKLSEVEWSISGDSGAHVAGDQQIGIKLDRLLVSCGLAESTTDASRKLKQGSVKVNDGVVQVPRLGIKLPAASPLKLAVRVGKRMKIAVINW